jgi:hypothetical protein
MPFMRVAAARSCNQYEQDAVQCELVLLFLPRATASRSASSAFAIDSSIRLDSFVRSGQAFQACGKFVFTFSGSL